MAILLVGGASYSCRKEKTAAEQETESLGRLRKAADQGNADAQARLGVRYAKGEGVPQDPAEAVRWFRKAADQGNADAQVFLGVMYDNGQGVPQDYAEAARWIR